MVTDYEYLLINNLQFLLILNQICVIDIILLMPFNYVFFFASGTGFPGT